MLFIVTDCECGTRSQKPTQGEGGGEEGGWGSMSPRTQGLLCSLCSPLRGGSLVVSTPTPSPKALVHFTSDGA